MMCVNCYDVLNVTGWYSVWWMPGISGDPKAGLSTSSFTLSWRAVRSAERGRVSRLPWLELSRVRGGRGNA